MRALLDLDFVMDYPVYLSIFSFAVMVLAAHIGAWVGMRRQVEPEVREQFGVIETATLTLLGLIIGFTFSMALNRYDQRKNYEEAEANAIGTEYLRADLLATADAARLRSLLRNYLAQRIDFYVDHDPSQLGPLAAATDRTQEALWAAVQPAAHAQPNQIVALVVSGMNDVVNSEGYTQAAWWNRIPFAAWSLMAAVALCCNVLVGLGASSARKRADLLLVLPIVVAIAYTLIADIDSPRGGMIHVAPQNLQRLAQSLPPP